jgi:spore coat protein CotH
LVFKRIIILSLLLSTVIYLEVSTEDTLFINFPSQEDVLEELEIIQNQDEIINDLLDASQKRDDEQDYENLFDHSIRHTFIIEFTQEEWDGLVNDMVSYNEIFGNYKSNNYRKVTVTYIADDEIFTIEDVGIRSKGNIYSRIPPVDVMGNVIEIHYMMKFNETFDLEEGTEEYEALKTREVFNLEQILFKRNNQNDPTYTNEVFAYSLFREAGVIVPNASFAEVQIVIDGKLEKVSLYNIFEHYDEEFIRRYFQDEPSDTVGDLYKGSWSGTLDPITDSNLYGVRDWTINYRPIYSKETNKLVDDYSNLVDFSFGINDSNLEDRRTFFEENFDTDNFMRAMALNVLLGNPDDYRSNGNNFYYYFDESNYMTYVPFDYDNCMGNGWDGMPAFTNYTLGNDIYEWGHFEWNYFGIPLWDNLIYYEDYQILYENYLMEFIESGLYSEETYLDIYNQVELLYGDTFTVYYDKEYFINEKINVVTEQVEYYRNQR